MTGARPIEPTEILPRATTGPVYRARAGRPVRRLPVGPLPMVASAAVVTAGLATATVLGGIKVALGIGRLLTEGTRGRPPSPADGVLLGFSTGSIVSAGLRIDWTHVEVRWGTPER